MSARSSTRRSPCPIACTLDLIGDRWTMVIIRDLFAGKSRYHEFQGSPEGIATNILAARLERLQADGLVRTRRSKEREGSLEYRLTPRGRALLPVLAAMRDWGLANVRGTEARVAIPAAR